MDRILELLASLTSLTADERTELSTLLAACTDPELAELGPQIQAAFETAAEDPTVDVAALPAFGDLAEEVAGITTARETATAERDAAIEAQRLRVVPAVVEDPAPVADPAVTDPSVVDGDPVVDPAADPAVDPAAPVAVAAAAPPAPRPGFPAVRAARPTAPAAPAAEHGLRRTMTLVASADLRDPLRNDTGRLRTRRDLTEAWAARMTSLSAFDGDGTFRVATLRSDYPEELRLSPLDDPRRTTRRIAAGLALAGGRDGQPLVASAGGDGADAPSLGDVLEALAAAGGLIAPVTPYYDELDISVADRPVADGLMSFQTERGGIVYVPPIQLAAMSAGVTKWTAANDLSLSSPATKNIVRITGGSTVTVNIRAIVARATIGNFLARTDPELVEDGLSKLMAAWAREAENDLLVDFTALSTDFLSTDHYFGYTRDFLGAALEAAAAYRQKHRMARNAVMEIHGLPVYAVDAIKADLARQLATDTSAADGGALAVTDAQVEAFLATKHLVLKTVTLDGATAQQFANAQSGWTPGVVGTPVLLPRFPLVAKWWICAPGTLVRLDGGELNIGVIRDSATSAVNDFQTFYEGFEAVANLGVDLWQVESTLVPDGASAGTAVASTYDAKTKVVPVAANNG